MLAGKDICSHSDNYIFNGSDVPRAITIRSSNSPCMAKAINIRSDNNSNKTTKLILLDSLLQEAEATLPEPCVAER